MSKDKLKKNDEEVIIVIEWYPEGKKRVEDISIIRDVDIKNETYGDIVAIRDNFRLVNLRNKINLEDKHKRNLLYKGYIDKYLDDVGKKLLISVFPLNYEYKFFMNEDALIKFIMCEAIPAA